MQERLIGAIAHDEPEAVAALAALGADLTKKDEHGRSPLSEATLRFYQRPEEGKSSLKIIRAILSAGADANERWGRNQESPLHLAMAGGSLEAARELVGAGALVNAQNSDGDTPLHLVARSPRLKPHSAAYLLSLGADARIKNAKGRVALQDAAVCNPEVALVIKAFTEANAAMRVKREQKAAVKKAPAGQSSLFEGESRLALKAPGEASALKERSAQELASKAAPSGALAKPSKPSKPQPRALSPQRSREPKAGS